MRSKDEDSRRPSPPGVGSIDSWHMLAEQAVLETMRTRAAAGKPLTVGTVPKEATEYLMRTARGALSRAGASREVVLAIRRLSDKGYIEAKVEAGTAWHVVRK